jgi:hypothetical protein
MPEPTPSPASSQPAWTDQATDLIVQTVGTVRDKTTGPAITAGRAIVYGTFAVLVSAVAIVLGLVLVIRLLTAYIPGNRVWVSYLIVGVPLCIAGLVLWGKARKPPTA